MSCISLAENMGVLTESRGWQLVGDLTLRDQVKCLRVSADGKDESEVFVEIDSLDSYSTCYASWFAVSEPYPFCAIFDKGEPVIERASTHPRTLWKLSPWSQSPLFDQPDSRKVADREDGGDGQEHQQDVVSSPDRSPVAIAEEIPSNGSATADATHSASASDNSNTSSAHTDTDTDADANASDAFVILENRQRMRIAPAALHNREHKLWDRVFRIDLRLHSRRSDGCAYLLLTKRLRKLFLDEFDPEREVAAFVLAPAHS